MSLRSVYRRRPVRYVVMVDGRQVGEPARAKWVAELEADELREESPWSHIEVAEVF